MYLSDFLIVIIYENDELESLITDRHTITIQEREKSFYNPQEMILSEDARVAVKSFCCVTK